MTQHFLMSSAERQFALRFMGFEIRGEWDADAGLFVLTSADIPGLVVTSTADLEDVFGRLALVVPALTEKRGVPKFTRAEPMQQSCSFCGKGRKEVLHIVEGPKCGICDECVTLSAEIISEKRNSPREVSHEG